MKPSLKHHFLRCFYVFKEPADQSIHMAVLNALLWRFGRPSSMDRTVLPSCGARGETHGETEKKTGRLYHGLMVYNHIVDGIITKIIITGNNYGNCTTNSGNNPPNKHINGEYYGN